MLDERLTLAASLYEPCTLGADIGTDHALLPVWLLEQGICEHMLLCDVSPKALAHARARVAQHQLEDRTTIVCTDGLSAIQERCGCISITGMGGDTLSGILRAGKERLQDAVLVLSAHTDQPEVRQTVQDIGYHIVREELCLCAGKWYILWRAEPGDTRMTEKEIRYGRLVYQQEAGLLAQWLDHRIQVLRRRLSGVRAAAVLDEKQARELEADIAYYQGRREQLS